MRSPSGSAVAAPSKATAAPVWAVSGASMTTTGAVARAVAGIRMTMLRAAIMAARDDVRDRASLRFARRGRYYGRPRGATRGPGRAAGWRDGDGTTAGRAGPPRPASRGLFPAAPVAALLVGQL